MNQIINFIINFLNGPMYWDSATFLSYAAILTSKTGNLFAYINSGSSDYPHTPLLIWTYALIFKILGPEYWRIGARLLSYSFAFILLFIGYKIIYSYTKNKNNALLIQLLIISDPIFWNQIYLSYFEIPGLLFRILALKNAINGKWKAYLCWGILAIGVRFDNIAYFLTLGIIFLLADLKNKKKIVLTSMLLTSIGAIWLIYHKTSTDWWLFGPTYGFDNSIRSTFQRTLSIFNLPYRKYLFAVFILVSIKAISHKKLTKLTLLTFVFIATNFSVALTTFPLIRYFIPTFWAIKMYIGISVASLYPKKISSLIIGLLIVWSIITGNMYTLSGNGEEMRGLAQELQTKKQFYSQIYPITTNQPILVDFPEDLEMSSADYGFIQKPMNFDPINIDTKNYNSKYCYILVTPTSKQTEGYAKRNFNDLIMVKQSTSQLGRYQLYKSKICQ